MKLTKQLSALVSDSCIFYYSDKTIRVLESFRFVSNKRAEED